MTWILGVNAPPAGWHDTAACLIDDTGHIYALAEEERFSRLKHGVHQQPRLAVAHCLAEAGIGYADIDVIALGWDAPRLYASQNPKWTYQTPDRVLHDLGFPQHQSPELVTVPHHRAHAYCAWYASGLASAAILVVDGNGEDESISIYEAADGYPMVRRQRWPRSSSLGLMYAAVSETLGFGLLGAGKTMGLASYGRSAGLEPWPMLDTEFAAPVSVAPDATYDDVMSAWHRHIANLVPLGLHRDLDQLHKDSNAVRLAWSAQDCIESSVAHLADLARNLTQLDDVCITGGVALNCSANGRLAGRVHAAPVPHDAGVALGAAWSLCNQRPHEPMSAYLGAAIAAPPVDGVTIAKIVDLLCRGKIGAIAEGRAEVGPRALGHRSIIAIPNHPAVRDDINRRKGREPWRPLAPVALPDHAASFWKPIPRLQRYMLAASEVSPDAHTVMPAAVHVDDTARAQILDERNSVLGRTLQALADNGVPPVLINTSLNTRGEPLANSSADALRAARSIGLDFLVLGDELLVQP